MNKGATNKYTGTTGTPGPQVVQKGQNMRIKCDKISKVLEHGPFKNKNTRAEANHANNQGKKRGESDLLEQL